MLVLWFSRDRAFQLHEALRTFALFERSPVCAARVEHAVLYRCSDAPHARAYRELQRRHPHVALEAESALMPSVGDGGGGFSSQLRALVAARPHCRFVLFCVDDALFFAPFSLSSAAALMDARSAVLAVQLALHPGLRFHQPTASALSLPAWVERLDHATLPWRLFEHTAGAGSHDFRYPFSLTASLYRRTDVEAILDGLHERALPCHAPNLLEAAGAALIATDAAVPALLRPYLPPPSPSSASSLSLRRPLCACPDGPVCAVLTVNRVQHIYRNPVCSTEEDCSAEGLLRLWERGEDDDALDEARYADAARAGRLISVHIGEWYTRRSAPAQRREADQ